ncbi:HSP20-like chaperone [Dipodascopsis tothii]|uniref:HSP20-like chaperone n=1 Tax=Dipodascopsis tothii TaxID=44089 RepID=UPI0034CF878F
MANVCTHKGCEIKFDKPDESPCVYHPGPPVFHDALKGWSCCKKRVISFDEFLAIPGCTTGTHSTEVAAPAPKPAAAPAPTSVDKDGKEVYGAAAAPAAAPQPVTAPPKAEPKETPLLEDPADAVIPAGAKCKRNGCSTTYSGARDGCVFHPGSAVFHDASKGWSCCKRRVLEFDEFLKIGGCTEGRHLFVALSPEEERAQKNASADKVECRTDFYQTPTTVIVSVFAKKCDKTTSAITFGPQTLALDLHMDGGREFATEFELYGPIDPAASTYRIMGTKVEITLAKASGTSWGGLRKGEQGAGMIRFGVSGRTGTVGGKEIVYRDQS